MSLVLYVDDDILCTEALSDLLETESINTVTFTSLEKAIDFVKRGAESICCAFFDYHMAEPGIEKRIHEISSSIPSYYLTGTIRDIQLPAGILGVLKKPYNLDEILKVIRRHSRK